MKVINSITIIVPCRNEIDYIEKFIDSVLSQQLDDNNMVEIIIADGMSEDGTCDKIRAIAEKDSRVHLIDNPDQTTPCGLNRAIKSATGDIIIRMDVHTEYAPDYVNQCVATLERSGADNVGGPWCAAGKSYLQKAIALAFQSSFSSGGAGSHDIGYEGKVDSVYLGCWKKTTLEKVGFFDEELVRNQDDELNLRLIRSGGNVWQSPKIRSCYYPRSSLIALFKQYSQYGYWKVRVIQKHKIPASFRHIVPGAFVFLLIFSLISSPFSDLFLFLFIFLIGAYGCANVIASLLTCRKIIAIKYIPVMPFVFVGFHFGYGYGFLCGIVDFLIFREKTNLNFERITR